MLTVGSTQHAALVDAALSEPVLRALRDRGVSRFVVQHGSYRPAALSELGGDGSAPTLDCFAYANDLDARLRRADLVISHAGASGSRQMGSDCSGAGSILTALRGDALATSQEDRRPLPLIIVPNATLMDDHQSELADELGKRKWAIVASADGAALAAAIRNIDLDRPRDALPRAASALSQMLDEELGYI